MKDTPQTYTADYCDGCGAHSRYVGRIARNAIDSQDNSGVYLCRNCWRLEMDWREQENRRVVNKFPILPFS